MPAFGFQTPPPDAGSATIPSLYRHTREIAASARLAMQGKINATGTVTLAAGATSTTLTDARLGALSVILFDPVTANAAAELAAGTLYVTTGNRSDGRFTLTHANAASTDRTFRYLVIG